MAGMKQQISRSLDEERMRYLDLDPCAVPAEPLLSIRCRGGVE